MTKIMHLDICLPERTYDGTDRKGWITFDSHYGHTNICKGTTKWRLPDGSIPDDTRPFATIEEMNKAIVDNINACVGENDILIHGGDFSFGGFTNIPLFRNLINCKTIHLVLGNHDDHIRKNKNNYQDLFTTVSDKLFINFTHGYNKNFIIVNHYPEQSWRDLNKGSIHIHGHCHLTGDKRFGKGRKMDGGMDGHPEFRPYDLFWECVVPLLNRPIISDLPFDHHSREFK
jgi:calcineurin-like phosphoesterase family protein